MSFISGRKKITVKGSNIGHKAIELYESVADIAIFNELETSDFTTAMYDKGGNWAFGGPGATSGHENYYHKPFVIDGITYFANRIPSKETISRRIINTGDGAIVGDYSLPNGTFHVFKSCSLFNSPEFDMYPMNVGWYPLYSDATSETSRNVFWHVELQIPLGTPGAVRHTHTIILSFGHRAYGGAQNEEMQAASMYNMGMYVHRVHAAMKSKTTATQSFSHIVYFDHNVDCTKLDPKMPWVPKAYTQPHPSSGGWYTNLILYTKTSPKPGESPYTMSCWHVDSSSDSHPTMYFNIHFKDDVIEPTSEFLGKYCNIDRLFKPPSFRFVAENGDYITMNAGEYYLKVRTGDINFYPMPDSLETSTSISNQSFNDNV